MNHIATIQPRSITSEMAGRFGMEPRPFEATLRATVVPKDCTREQFAAFLMVARDYRLNPITKEIFAFPTRAGGIQPIVSVDGWMNLMNSHPQMDGLEFDDIKDESGNLTAIKCRVYRKDRRAPIEVIEYMSECRRNTDTWKTWPARMLRHKAAIQAARYAFGFSGIVEPDEFERMNDSGAVVRSITPPSPPSPPPAPPAVHAEPVAKATVIDVPSVDAHAGKIADWTARLIVANADIRDEIFEAEIDPYREAGNLTPAEYNELVAAGE